MFPPRTDQMAALAGFSVPQVSPDELYAFHEAHFSQHSISDFKLNFLAVEKAKRWGNDTPASHDDFSDADNDHGYYEEQVVDQVQADFVPISLDIQALMSGEDDLPAEPGEVVEESPKEAAEDAPKEAPRKKRRRKKNNGVRRRVEEKPDLRKRTWDIVDTGLGSLDYDGLESNEASAPAQPQRRRVQYGDD